MSRIFCIVGKSGAGKDTFYRAVLKKYGDALTPVIPCTTRPMREGERNGEEYFFVSPSELRSLEERGQVIEKREYHTVHGLWTYFTRRFSLMEGRDYIVITTLEGVKSFMRAFGKESVKPVYLELPDGARLHRCLAREDAQIHPDYAEMCRRFLADERDFSRDKLGEIPNLTRLDASKTVEELISEWDRVVGRQ